MSNLANSFNRSGFAKFINTMAGRWLRIAAGIAFIVVGYIYRNETLGIVSMIWGLVPLSAGMFDLCYISALLGGPFSGATIRAGDTSVERMKAQG